MAALLKLAAVIAAAFAATAHAHMRLFDPPPFGAENNPHRTDPADDRLDYPHDCCGRETPFPCRGYLDQLGTDQGRPVATWAAGSVQNFSLVGQGNHWGGSCQAGFSVDDGKSWKVVRSWEGACPHRSASSYDASQNVFPIKVPADMPRGDHVFAWTWFNREQEFFMTCAAITITGREQRRGCGSNDDDGDEIPFDQRPSFLVANVEQVNDCRTPRTTAEVKYPHPGSDVVQGDGEYPLEHPHCGV